MTTNTNVNTKAEAEAQRTFELYPTLQNPAGNYPPPPPPPLGPILPPQGSVPHYPPPGYVSYQAGPSTPPGQESTAERTPLVSLAQDGSGAPSNRTVTTTVTTTTITNPGVFTEETTCGQECVSALWLWGGLSWLVAVCYWLFALVYLLSIVGIPIGLDAMRAARLVQVCHGRQFKWKYEQVGSCSQTMKCIFWFPCGICVAVLHFALGVVLCCTLVGIPFGITHFKLVPVAICPFGLELHQGKH